MYEAEINKLTHKIWNNPKKWFLLRESDELRSNVSFDPTLDIHYRAVNRYEDMLHDSNIMRFYLYTNLDLLKWRPEYFYMKLTTVALSNPSYSSKRYVFEFDRARRIMHFYETEKERKTRIRWITKEEIVSDSNNPKPSSDCGFMKKITSYFRRAMGREFKSQEKELAIRERYIPIHEEKETSRDIELLNLSRDSLVDWNSVFGNLYFAVNGSRNIIKNKVRLDATTRNYFLKSLNFVEEDIPSLEKIRYNLGIG